MQELRSYHSKQRLDEGGCGHLPGVGADVGIGPHGAQLGCAVLWSTGGQVAVSSRWYGQAQAGGGRGPGRGEGNTLACTSGWLGTRTGEDNIRGFLFIAESWPLKNGFEIQGTMTFFSVWKR